MTSVLLNLLGSTSGGHYIFGIFQCLFYCWIMYFSLQCWVFLSYHKHKHPSYVKSIPEHIYENVINRDFKVSKPNEKLKF